ncbi:MAG: hypothetical protein HQ534_11035 [Armatimonadetes bacterium]|nr:hypothetical protein [Armatimonadota bacterium]
MTAYTKPIFYKSLNVAIIAAMMGCLVWNIVGIVLSAIAIVIPAKAILSKKPE